MVQTPANILSATPDPREEPLPTYRTPPHNYEAEQALIGAILVRNTAYERVSEFLRAEHFADAVHGRVFGAAGRLIERGQIANPVTLKQYFEQDGALTEVGGVQYLARLAASAVTTINAEHYARNVYDLYLRRALIDLGDEVVNTAFESDIDRTALDQIENAEKKLFDLATTGDVESGFRAFPSTLKKAVEMAEAAYKRDGRLTGIPTRLVDIDRLLGGLQPSDLLILAGRPGMGKTALATNIAFNAAKAYREERDESGNMRAVDGAVVGFFSLEMSAEQLAMRVLAEESGVRSDLIRRGQLTDGDFERMVQASQTLERIPMFIDDTPGLTVTTLRTRARRLKRQHGLSLIVVDYLQLLQPGGASRYDSRVLEISEITRGLKILAKEINVPVLALSQLSRAVEQRDDKRPQLADLRESGSIEQDADVVMFIFREEYYWRKNNPQPRWAKEGDPDASHYQKLEEWNAEFQEFKGKAEIIVAKQRHGPTDTVNLYFDEAFTKFGNFITSDKLPEDVPY